MADTRRCPRCKEVKPRSDFNRTGYADKVDGYCKPCRAEYKRERRAKTARGGRPHSCCQDCGGELHGSPVLRNSVAGSIRKYSTVCFDCYRPERDEPPLRWKNPDRLRLSEVRERVYWRWLYYAVGRNEKQGRAKMDKMFEEFGGVPYEGFTVGAGKYGRNFNRTNAPETPTVDEVLVYIVRRSTGLDPDSTADRAAFWDAYRREHDAMFARAVKDGIKTPRVRSLARNGRGVRAKCLGCDNIPHGGDTVDGLCFDCHTEQLAEAAA